MSTTPYIDAFYRKQCMKRVYISSILIYFVCACASDDEVSVVVDVQLEEYFELFIKEAQVYGYDLSEDVSLISGYLEVLTGTTAAGQCKTYSDGRREIVIDSEYWQRADPLEREFLLFHELGHCVLDRDHNDGHERGICLSIMESGTGGCRTNYSTETRETYLKELFNY